METGFAFLIEKIANEQGAEWEKFLSPAPMGIAIMGQVMIFSSRITDFQINTNNPGHLIIHPESFRATLAQISNEAYKAFDTAHRNMEKILFQMTQVPNYIQESVEIIKSGNQSAIEKMLKRRLDRIFEAASEGGKLSKEVSNAFKQLIELIDQVLIATTFSRGIREQQIAEQVEKDIEEEKERLLNEKKNKLRNMEKQREDKQDVWNLCQNYIRQLISPGNLLQRCLPQVVGASIQTAAFLITPLVSHKINQRLQEIENEKNQVLEEMKKINEDYFEKLKNMQIDVTREIDRDHTVNFLRQGLGYLSELRESWDGMTQFFGTVESVISGTTTAMMDFVEDAKDSANEPSFIDLMADNILRAKQTSYLTHCIANMYVKVSNRYIKSSLVGLEKMTTLNGDQLIAAQEELMGSCKEAAEGILEVVKEDKDLLFEKTKNFRKYLEDEKKKNGTQ